MKITAAVDLDLIDLFLHDKCCTYPIADTAVAEALMVELAIILEDDLQQVRVIAPSTSGLSRFTIWAYARHYTERIHTVEKLKFLLPLTVFNALSAIAKCSMRLSLSSTGELMVSLVRPPKEDEDGR